MGAGGAVLEPPPPPPQAVHRSDSEMTKAGVFIETLLRCGRLAHLGEAPIGRRRNVYESTDVSPPLPSPTYSRLYRLALAVQHRQE